MIEKINHKRRGTRDHKQQHDGFALLIVLWSMVLLSAVVTRIVATGRSDAQLAANLLSAAAVETAADGAVYLAAFDLLAHVPEWAADGTAHIVSMPGAVTAEIWVKSEDGKINPNLAAPDLLAAVLQEAGAAPFAASVIADNILQWRVAWPRSASPNPALNTYQAAGLAYGPPGAPFQSLDEVGAVLGMTPELFVRIQPFLSLYAPREPNPAYASHSVLDAMGAAASKANLPGAGRRSPAVVRVRAVASRPDGARFTRNAVLRLSSGQEGAPVDILAWKREWE